MRLHLSLILICLGLASSPGRADDLICFDGGRRLALKNAEMTIDLPLDGKTVQKRVPVEHVVGSTGRENHFEVLGFFTFDEMRKKFCPGNITGVTAIYYPSYERVIGQNGFYWYLTESTETLPVNHLMLSTGWVREGKCVNALEGSTYYVIPCR